MKYSNKIVNPEIILFCCALCLAIFFLYACSGSSGSDESDSNDGALSFALEFKDRTSASFYRAGYSPSGDVCVDYGITLIGADVFDSMNSNIASDSWPCSDHQGTFDDIPAGTGYSLIVEGVMDSGDVDWRGEIAGITVTAGEVTNVGIIILIYVGDDETPPVVVSTVPAEGEVCLPTDGVITAVFSEAMISATVNESTFTLKTGTTLLSGTVEYDPSTQTATFTPDNNLSFGKSFTATISKDVEDMARNQMAETVSWSFTTNYAGDYDNDCDVDGDDLSTFSSAYAAGSPEADLNDDGEVNAEDVELFSMGFGHSANVSI